MNLQSPLLFGSGFFLLIRVKLVESLYLLPKLKEIILAMGKEGDLSKRQNRDMGLLKEVRRQLFFHLEGIPTTFVVNTLMKKGFFSYASHNEQFTFEELRIFLQANEGYLKIALRLLCSLGWLSKEGNWKDPKFRLTEMGQVSMELLPAYRNAADILPSVLDMSVTLSGADHKLLQNYHRLVQLLTLNWRIDFTDQQRGPEPQERVIHQLNGLVAGPTLVYLSRMQLLPSEDLQIRNQDLLDAGISADAIFSIKALLQHLAWIKDNEAELKATKQGQLVFARAYSYGVTVSYLPMFGMLDDLLFKNPNVLWEVPKGAHEKHVDRAMNVWGSGGAHSTYFKRIDEIVLDIFSGPIEQQPKGIADMGCGDGKLLIHLYQLIKDKTERGRMLDKHPLQVIGIDFNAAALVSTKANLEAAGVPFQTTFGDIGDPETLNEKLKSKFNLELKDFLNVRSFLDHNRMYNPPQKPADHRLQSTGAFSFRGKALDNQEVIQSLIEHFEKWLPHVKKHGLLVLELHGLDHELTAANGGKTPIIAYEGTHGFSDQYILELPVYLNAAERAGLHIEQKYQNQFPRNELACISINLLN